MTSGLLQKALLAALFGSMLSATTSAKSTCNSILTPYPGVTIPAETRIAGRRFGGISGVDFDPIERRVVYVSDERVAANSAVIFRSSKISALRSAFTPIPSSIQPLKGLGSDDGIDLEALRIGPRKDEWWIASEGGETPSSKAWIGRFDRGMRLVSRIALPAPFDAAPHNRSIESLAFDVQGRLWVALENALPMDGPQGNRDRGAELRIFQLNIADRASSVTAIAADEESLLYLTEPAEPGDRGNSDVGISEMLRVDDSWWVIERAGLAGEDGRYRFRSRLFCAERDPTSAGRLRKTLLLDLTQFADPLEANFEAMTIIPRHRMPPLLMIVNDNNFAPGVTTRVLLWEITRP